MTISSLLCHCFALKLKILVANWI